MTAQTWLITGASSGLCRALAEHVLAQGDNAVLAARGIDSPVTRPTAASASSCRHSRPNSPPTATPPRATDYPDAGPPVL